MGGGGGGGAPGDGGASCGDPLCPTTVARPQVERMMLNGVCKAISIYYGALARRPSAANVGEGGGAPRDHQAEPAAAGEQAANGAAAPPGGA